MRRLFVMYIVFSSLGVLGGGGCMAGLGGIGRSSEAETALGFGVVLLGISL